jgi:DNA modification methylase
MAERDAASLDSLLDQLSKTDADFADLIHHIEAENKALTQEPGTLAEKFLVPPFSVLDARQGYWQERKRAWLSLGIKSEEGRPENLLQFSDTVSFGGKKNRDMTEEYEGGDAWANSGTSIFDPVLCELVYRWFLPPSGGSVLDPFAGGSVRGVVAAKLGHRYTGVELRTEQVLANRKQAEQLKCDTAEWIQGDSNSEVKKLKKHYDLLFSCPPYFDLEKYSDDPNDLSNAKSYEKFFETYFSIIDDCCNQLIPEAFACFVVSDIRDPGGVYRGFVADTIRAFKTCGMDLYNDAVLVQPVGTLPLRISKSFGKYRKLGRVHKNVLVFHRGNPKGIVDLLGEASYSPDDWMELFGIPAGAEEAEA